MTRFTALSRFAACAMIAISAYPAAMAGDAASTPPILPVAFKADSTLKLNHDDLDYVLANTVLPLGRSDHEAAARPEAPTGSRFLMDNPSPSRLEGNRVMFHEIKDQNLVMINDIRDAMLDLPRRVPLDRLSKNEQLAYWFNLHNVIVLAEIANRYPMVMIDTLWEDCAKETSFACERRFNLAGETMVSLRDIENHVLANWKDPLVIYGFYMGAVGTPNIRSAAFRGDDVWEDLQDNAVDFVNSVRGTRLNGKTKLRVSTYYETMAQMFPDFQADLMNHLRTYARGEFKSDLDVVNELKANIDDWHIADLYNGHLVAQRGAQTVETKAGRFPPHVARLLEGVVERHRNRLGTVYIEDLPSAPKAAEEEKDDEIVVTPNPGP